MNLKRNHYKQMRKDYTQDQEKLLQEITLVKNKLDGLQQLLDIKKKQVRQLFDESGIDNMSNNQVCVYRQDRPKIDYDIDMMLSALPREVTNRCIKRTYTVKDWKKFIKLLKFFSVPIDKIRSLVQIDREVDQKALSDMFDRGELSIEDLDGLYEMEIKRSIVIKSKNDNANKSTIPID